MLSDRTLFVYNYFLQCCGYCIVKMNYTLWCSSCGCSHY